MLLNSLPFSNSMCQTYIACHGISDLIAIKENPKLTPDLFISYTIPITLCSILPNTVSLTLFTLLSSFHFRHEFINLYISIFLTTATAVFRRFDLLEFFLLVHSTHHYYTFGYLFLRNKLLSILSGIITIYFTYVIPVKYLLAIATGHIIFCEFY